jgi:hypothetical protein
LLRYFFGKAFWGGVLCRWELLSNKRVGSEQEVAMKKVIAASVMSLTLGLVPLMAQEKKEMPMKEGMPMKSEEMQGSGMMMGKMKDMHGEMGEMKKGMSGMMKGQGMMKNEDMKNMEKMMGDMSGMMGDMGKMMGGGKMSPEEMGQMSKMMGDMSGMMKQMSERMKKGAGKTQ